MAVESAFMDYINITTKTIEDMIIIINKGNDPCVATKCKELIKVYSDDIVYIMDQIP